MAPPTRPSSFDRFTHVESADGFDVFGTSGPARAAGGSLSNFGRGPNEDEYASSDAGEDASEGSNDSDL